MNRISFIIYYSFCCIFIYSCGAIISNLVPFENLPIPSGNYKVGTRVYTWVDTERYEWFTDISEDYRKIVVQIWYPAISVSGIRIGKYPIS